MIMELSVAHPIIILDLIEANPFEHELTDMSSTVDDQIEAHHRACYATLHVGHFLFRWSTTPQLKYMHMPFSMGSLSSHDSQACRLRCVTASSSVEGPGTMKKTGGIPCGKHGIR